MDTFSSYQTGDGGTDLQKMSHSIGSNIQKISQNVKSIQQLVNQLGTEQDSQQLRAQLHKVQHYTGGLAKDTSTEIRTFQALQLPAGEDARIWKMQRERLTREFTEALNGFQAAQREAASKEKEALKRARADSDAHYFEDKTSTALLDLGGNSGGGGGGGNRLQQQQQQQMQMQQQMEQEAEVHALQERETHIKQLESDIQDVNQIFKDLATMVHEQGETIDSIEANVESAQVHVARGGGEIRDALRYQNKARRKRVCLIIISVVVLAIVIGLIVWSSQ
ncbi:syntaxin-7-like isoform X2 [Oratosquilla oratoria]|uniref:syntaxin-7-like isoform X2 n=1 Tax=Oratosquilla oratoria TaxID=337810 RepID=UPI003F76A198